MSIANPSAMVGVVVARLQKGDLSVVLGGDAGPLVSAAWFTGFCIRGRLGHFTMMHYGY